MEGDPPPEAPFSMAAGRAAATARGPATAGECATAAPLGSLFLAGGVLAGHDLDTTAADPGRRAAGGAQSRPATPGRRTATPGRHAACPGADQTSTGAAQASTGG